MRIMPNAKTPPEPGRVYRLRLKWGMTDKPIIGHGLVIDPVDCVATVPVTIDGDFHEYEIPLAGRSDWKGTVDELWFEACELIHCRVAIDWLRFEQSSGAILPKTP